MPLISIFLIFCFKIIIGPGTFLPFLGPSVETDGSTVALNPNAPQRFSLFKYKKLN